MGGTAVSSGADNQAAVAAYVAVRMLLERPLNWSAPMRDTPTSIAGEVGGPGDDFRINFGTSRSPLETQCKRTLAGKAALASAITDIAEQLATVPPEHEVVLVVGSGSSSEIRDTFAMDVRNFRQGRRDGLRRITQSILSDVDGTSAVLSRLYVVTLDVDTESGTGAQFALDGLRQALKEPERAEAAWAVLVSDSLKLARRGQWDRAAVVNLLVSRGFHLRSIGADAPWLEQIDYARTLNANWRSRTASGLLDHLAQEIQGKAVGAELRRQLHSVHGAAYLALEDFQKAREQFGRALEYATAPTASGEPMPPDQLKRWLDARFNYGFMLNVHEEYVAAEEIARDILTFDSRHIHAWMLLTFALSAQELDVEPPPADLANAPEYRDALAQSAVRRGDWTAAVHAAAPVLNAGHRQAPRLTAHAMALINVSTELPRGPERTLVLEQAERTADEAVRTLENGELDLKLSRALFMRGRARDDLDRSTEAIPDYERAAVLAPTDVNVLIRTAQIRRAGGDRDGALALLTDEAVESAVVLRALRAEIRAESGAQGDAVNDLLAAVDELPSVAKPAEVELYLNIGAMALELGQRDLAERAVRAVETADLANDGPDPGVLRARIEVANKRWDAAEAAYRAAAARGTGGDASKILGEFATALSIADQDERAIDVYVEAGIDDPRNPFFRNLITSLMRAGRFGRVMALVAKCEEEAIQRGDTLASLPPSLLDAATDIAWRQEDFAGSARVLDARLIQEEAGGKEAPTASMLTAAYAHAKTGNLDRSRMLVDAVLSRAELGPEDRMRAAKVLIAIGVHQRAIDVAFTAVRTRPSDKRMITDFINVVVAPDLPRTRASITSEQDGGDEMPRELAPSGSHSDVDSAMNGDDDDDVGTDGKRGIVGPDTFVRMRTDDGQRYDYFLYSDPPTDARLNEYLMTDPVVADLIGKSVGDVVVRNRGTWGEQRLSVSRVMPAVVMVFRRYMRTFAAQFPEEPMFRMFNIGPNPTVDSLAQIIATARLGTYHAEDALAKYEDTPIPLGVLARTLGKPLINVALSIAAGESRLHTDGPPYSDYDASSKSLKEATTVILTRPALAFLDELGLWNALTARYRLIAPRSMMDEWDEEIRQLEATAHFGRVSLREVSGRPTIETIPIGAADFALRASRSLHEGVAAAATVLHRPVSALTADDDKWRELLGAPSFDAVAVARSESAMLYADDLGLRAVAEHQYHAQSFPTAALLDLFHSEGLLTDDEFEQHTVRLIELGHDMVPIRGSTVVAAFGRAGSSTHTADRVLARLADARVTAVSAAVVAVTALRGLAMASVTTTTLSDAAERVTEALIRERDPADIIPTFGSVLRQAFILLPSHRNTIEAAVGRALQRNRIVRPG